MDPATLASVQVVEISGPGGSRVSRKRAGTQGWAEVREIGLGEVAGGVPVWQMDGRTFGRARRRGSPWPSAVSRAVRPADVHERAERQHEQSGRASERGMRAGMEDGRMVDAPRSRGLPGMPSREDGNPRARCRAGWGVGRRAAVVREVISIVNHGHRPFRTLAEACAPPYLIMLRAVRRNRFCVGS